MSEAQYVCTGDIKGELGLSHYGLGLEKYTHFTSPIRRYADVVVHHQLLLSLNEKKVSAVPPPPGFDRGPLASLPQSETISVLRGEREGADETSVPIDPNQVVSKSKDFIALPKNATNSDHDVFSNSEVSRICGILNQQNRMAKLSSFECQNLFLSLYFKDSVEVTQAVVTNLRSNGFFAYVPRFDFRAPVYISDRNGDLQIDPSLLLLNPSSGLPPTAGFAASSVNRKFPTGKCSLQSGEGSQSLKLSVADTPATYELKVLDVVTVTLSCDWDAKSRVPQPRIHLIANTSGKPNIQGQSSQNMAPSLSRVATQSRNASDTTNAKDVRRKETKNVATVYEEIQTIQTPPVLDNVEIRTKERNQKASMPGESTITGRIVFCTFVNPDTRSGQQEASILEASEAAAERRNQIMEARARHGEYDATKRIEKDVTARMQRLAVNKRNAKRGKNK